MIVPVRLDSRKWMNYKYDNIDRWPNQSTDSQDEEGLTRAVKVLYVRFLTSNSYAIGSI